MSRSSLHGTQQAEGVQDAQEAGREFAGCVAIVQGFSSLESVENGGWGSRPASSRQGGTEAIPMPLGDSASFHSAPRLRLPWGCAPSALGWGPGLSLGIVS